jgi:SPP1 family predicted phage head-tail adaptor
VAWISAGELDRRVSLQRLVRGRGVENEPVEDWCEFGEVWGSKRDVAGKKELANGEVVATVTTLFKIRWRSDVTAQCRVVCEGETYDVADLRQLGRREALQFAGAKRND